MIEPSALRKGQEQYREFYSQLAKAKRVQYDYRSTRGLLFSCVACSLEEAREKKNDWLKQKGWTA